MLAAFTLLLVCQLGGDILARLSGVPVPGPVIGLALLLIGLMVRRRLSRPRAPQANPPGTAPAVPATLDATASGLLHHLPVLFVPSGVGIMANLPLLSESFAPLAGAIVLGTLVTIGLTGWVLQALTRRDGPAGRGRGRE